MESAPSTVVALVGPSGAGKTTLMRALLNGGYGFRFISSNTTRSRRESDLLDEYRYFSEDEFHRKDLVQKFLWTVELHGTWYGTLREDVDAALWTPGERFLIVNAPQTLEILLRYAESTPGYAHAVYVVAPPREELIRRLRERGEKEETIQRRVSDCQDWDREARTSSLPYHYIDNNGTIEEAVAQLLASLPQIRP